MTTSTKFSLTIVTEKDLVSHDAERFVANIETFVQLLKLTGIGERVGIKDIKVRLSDKPAA